MVRLQCDLKSRTLQWAAVAPLRELRPKTRRKPPPPTVSTEKTIGLVKKVPVRPDPNAIGGTCSRYSEVPSKIVIGCGNVELRLEDDKGNEVARTSILHRKFSFSLKEDKIYFLSAVSKEYETVPSRVGPLHRGQVIEIKVKSLSK